MPAVLAAAKVAPGQRVLEVSTGTGEAALAALPIVCTSGLVIGADIAPAMHTGGRGAVVGAAAVFVLARWRMWDICDRIGIRRKGLLVHPVV